jgi:hypothetical protein
MKRFLIIAALLATVGPAHSELTKEQGEAFLAEIRTYIGHPMLVAVNQRICCHPIRMYEKVDNFRAAGSKLGFSGRKVPSDLVGVYMERHGKYKAFLAFVHENLKDASGKETSAWWRMS